MSYIGTKDYLLEVAKGKIDGEESFNKFGKNPRVRVLSVPEDCWNGGGLYTGFPTIADELEIFSDSSQDSASGTGARTVEISNLQDINRNEMPPITLTMNGTTPVSLGSGLYFRASRVKVLTTGTEKGNVGEITLRHKNNVLNIFAVLPVGYNQTTIFAYSVPAGKTLYAHRINFNMSRTNGSSGSAMLSFLVSVDGAPFTSKITPQITHSEGYLFDSGYRKYEEKTDFVLRAMDISDNTTEISGELDGILVTNV